MNAQWYKDAVLYELDVRSFCDGDRDGVGDFPGLTDKLDYLQELGVTALVLGPPQPAPAREDAHHTAGHHTACGSVQDLERLLPEAHARGIRVITELPVSQLSDQAHNVDHPRVRWVVLKVMRHWLDVGVDGLTLSGIPSLVEGEETDSKKPPETHTLVKEMRALIEQQYAERVLLAQTNRSPDHVTKYFGDGDECHMAFDVSLMSR